MMAEKMDDQISQKLPPEQVHSVRMLILITNTKLAKKAEQMFKEGHVQTVYRSHGRGTASSETMDMLGLSDVDKSIIICMMPKPFADEMLKKLRKQLQLGMVNTGVAFTVPISGANSKTLKLIERLREEETGFTHKNVERKAMKMEDLAYALIVVIVNRGYSEEVMEVAREKGATGGTVINSRWVGSNEEALHFWEISVQPEREMILILANHDEKKDIMKAIGENYGMKSEAHGVVMSLPVDGVAGLD